MDLSIYSRFLMLYTVDISKTAYYKDWYNVGLNGKILDNRLLITNVF